MICCFFLGDKNNFRLPELNGCNGCVIRKAVSACAASWAGRSQLRATLLVAVQLGLSSPAEGF